MVEVCLSLGDVIVFDDYKSYHVSNKGGRGFSIDPDTDDSPSLDLSVRSSDSLEDLTTRLLE
jgi:hypothetical protein